VRVCVVVECEWFHTACLFFFNLAASQDAFAPPPRWSSRPSFFSSNLRFQVNASFPTFPTAENNPDIRFPTAWQVQLKNCLPESHTPG
jgi:hypothetical protein